MKGTKRTTAALTILAAVVLTPAATAQPGDVPRDFLDQAEYAPGGVVKIELGPLYNCAPEATSAGFAAPIKLNPVPTATIGEGEAAATPGTYQARIFCKAGSLVDSFTVKAPVTTTTPPPQKPAKPPVKKPKGAPQTGGGGTA
ncbi:hypothetical protein BBK82_18835 [Lentzea guizhouensis]|uniref:Uncharacterized protein n=1 Tax=Lentzea guizhouensis TaxID=1586287 RepID=A0A1B2HJC2_9PSEU|nr:hypothetical protein [Lentzea guizhouensis]ANZ37811.1 hypothetical protein BBK82_18835 [Lentzea guizhouensis]